MNKAERVRAFSDYLKKEGFVPTIDQEGDIQFKVEGRIYFVVFDEDDEEFFRILFPGFWKIESEEERLRVEAAALKATIKTKVAKVYPVQDNTWASVELFCGTPEHAQDVFIRSLGALQAAVHIFAEAMRE